MKLLLLFFTFFLLEDNPPIVTPIENHNANFTCRSEVNSIDSKHYEIVNSITNNDPDNWLSVTWEAGNMLDYTGFNSINVKPLSHTLYSRNKAYEPFRSFNQIVHYGAALQHTDVADCYEERYRIDKKDEETYEDQNSEMFCVRNDGNITNRISVSSMILKEENLSIFKLEVSANAKICFKTPLNILIDSVSSSSWHIIKGNSLQQIFPSSQFLVILDNWINNSKNTFYNKNQTNNDTYYLCENNLSVNNQIEFYCKGTSFVKNKMNIASLISENNEVLGFSSNVFQNN